MMKYNFRLSEIDLSTIFSSSNAPRRQKGLEQGQFFCLRVLFFAELKWHLSFKEGRRKFTFAYFIRSQFIPRLYYFSECHFTFVLKYQSCLSRKTPYLYRPRLAWFSRDIKPCSDFQSKAVTLPTNLFKYLSPPPPRPHHPSTLPAFKMSKCALWKGFTRSTCQFHSVRSRSSD